MRKTFYIMLILIFTSLTIFSQITKEENESFYNGFIKPKYGKNLLYYSHWYIGGGLILVTNKNAELPTNYLFSNYTEIGYRYKLKLNNTFSIGTAPKYQLYTYSMKTPIFNVSNPEEVTDKIKFNKLAAELYLRTNFGKRNNDIGKFIDIAFTGAIVVRTKHIIYNKTENYNLYKAKNSKFVHSNLNYVNHFNMETQLRIGSNRTILFINYLITKNFNNNILENTNVTEQQVLPKITVGIQIGLH